MLEVEHPAAKVLVELAHLQDEEVGDGTTSVVIIAAELLKVCSKNFSPAKFYFLFLSQYIDLRDNILTFAQQWDTNRCKYKKNYS